jgi:hypothetical protein
MERKDMSNFIETSEVRGTGVVIIDMDSGTVLGTNLRMCYVPSHMMDAVLSSDHAATQHAIDYGIPLFVEETLDG